MVHWFLKVAATSEIGTIMNSNLKQKVIKNNPISKNKIYKLSEFMGKLVNYDYFFHKIPISMFSINKIHKI